MAETVCRGIDGGMTFPTGTGFRANMWRGEFQEAIHDASGFTSGGDEENEHGMRSFSFSAAGVAIKGTVNTARPRVGSFIFQASDGCTIACEGRVGRYALDTSIADNVKVALEGRANGAVTEVWDDGTP